MTWRTPWRRWRLPAGAALGLAALLLPVAADATTQPDDPGNGRIGSLTETGPGVQFVYSGTDLPSGVGFDLGTVSASFAPEGEDPLPLEVTVAPAETVDRRVVLALDISRSLGDDGIDAVREAATTFVTLLPEGTEIGLVVFDRPARTVLQPTADRGRVLAEIADLELAGNTALYDAVAQAASLLKGSEGSTSVLLMTDGRDEAEGPGTIGSDITLAEAVADVEASGATLTAVALGDAAVDPLQQLADAGGGQQVINAGDLPALDAAFQRVAEAIATELLVTATVPDDLRGVDGLLAVSAEADGSTVVATRGGVLLEVAVAPPSPTPTASADPEPTVEVAPTDQAAPPPAAEDRQLLPASVLYVAVGSLFLALLLVAGVLVGLLTRRESPASVRERSLAVYSLRGQDPVLVQRETTQTRLGDNAVARSAVELAGRLVDRRGLTEDLGRRLEAASIPLRPAEWFVLHIGAVLTTAALLLLLSGGNPLAMVIGAVVGFVAPQLTLSVRRARRERAFLMVLPDSLGLLASGLRAGYSMPQAMDSVARESQEPVRSEFNRALVEARLGVPPEDALDGIARRMGSPDFRWVVMAIRVQREVGGNLAELLDTVSGTLRERARLKRQVDVLSAEGRLSAWIVGALPIAFALYLALSRPDYLSVLYRDPLGISLSILAVVVFVIGVLGLRWAVKVDV